MKNYLINLRRVIGDQTNDGFRTAVRSQGVDLQVPNFTQRHQEDVYPKIVIKAFISYIPIETGESKDGSVVWTLHEGRIQIDVMAKNEEQCIDIVSEINYRFGDFFSTEIIDFTDPYEWSTVETDVKVNANYDTERTIISYGNYTKVDSLNDCKSTNHSWFLDNTGFYVHGDINLLITELVNGRVFENGETIQERGFIGINDKTPLREVNPEEYDTNTFSLEYEVFYKSYRDRKQAGEVDEIHAIASQN